ncbi:unnamed protein product [Heterobilharzia americana]|nr:unnamed protein product [Heterobilharzia americana]
MYGDPYLEFFAVGGYCLLDIRENVVFFTSKKSPDKICYACISDLPIFDLVHKSSTFINFLRIQLIFSGIVIVFVDGSGIGILKFSKLVDVPKNVEKIEFLEYVAEGPPVVCVNPSFSVVVVGDRKCLKACRLEKNKNTLITVGVNLSKVKDIGFHPSTPNYVFVLSEDLTCGIWDICACKQIQTLSVLKTTTLDLSLFDKAISLGTKDGQVLSLCPLSFQCIQLFTLPEQPNKNIIHNCCPNSSSLVRSANGRSTWSNDGALVPSISTEFSNEIVVLSRINFVTDCTQNGLKGPSKIKSNMLVVLSRAKLYIIDLSNQSITASWRWIDLELSNWVYIHDAGIAITSQSINFWVRGNNDSVGFFAIPLENILSSGESKNVLDSMSTLSLIARDNLLANSVLNKCNKHDLLRSNTKTAQKNTNHFSNFNKSLNKPVTFGHTIKSSGYAKQEPMRKMFHPMVNGHAKPMKTTRLINEGKLTKLTKLYPVTEEVPSVLQISGSLDASSTPVYKVAYSRNGICLVTRCDQNTEEKRRKLFSSAEALRGHMGPVLWASWSTNSRLLLTCSSDRTARIWRIGSVKELDKTLTAKVGPTTQLIFDSIHGGATNDYGERVNIQRKKNYHEPFQDSVSIGNFHYMDSFVYLVSQNIIRLYSYTLSDNKNILEKSFPNNTYKLVGEFSIQTCNQLTSVASVNLFYSYLILCAGSDHRLSILDLNSGQIIRETESAHNRCITGIALNQGSLYSSFCNTNGIPVNGRTLGAGYTVYATVAPKDGIRIWDLRESWHPVMKLVRFPAEASTTSGASRNALIPPVTVVFSPCGTKLLAGGTTDAKQSSPVIYDIRQPSTHPLAILNPEARNTSPATVVDWHPLRPEVSSGSHDGILSIYGIPKSQTKFIT